MNSPKQTVTKLLLAGICLGISGCASDDQGILSAPELLAQAELAESNADYQKAVQLYSDLEANHPFGPYAQQALLNLAHLEFSNREFESAIRLADRFIRQYPSHPNIDYARYLRAVSLQRDRVDFLDQLIVAQKGTNSRKDLTRAYQAYIELIELHPDSGYIDDAMARINEIVNLIADSELKTAIHYMRLGAYGASVRRSSKVISSYPDSTAVETALAVMIASLTEMGSKLPLDDAVVSLQQSYPNSHLLTPATAGVDSLLAYLDIEKQPGTWFTRMLE